MKNRIMVVDDEASIRRSLSDILIDEGFDVILASDGHEALRRLDTAIPDLILLDIWMPGMDGTEVLKEIKTRRPDIKVIVISGHGTIETAVKATKLGASDYIEKPLSLEGVLLAIRRALAEGSAHIEAGKEKIDSASVRKTAEAEEDFEGVYIPQRTIRKSIVVGGQGLHSGIKTGLILSPLPPNSGIIFNELSSEETVPAHLDYVHSTDYATTIKSGHISIMTIEHLMAVLHIYKITNILIKTGYEIPILDGSARRFCQLIEDAGIEEQDEFVEELTIDSTYTVGNINGDGFISAMPSPELIIQYSMGYPPSLGIQEARFVLESTEVFKQEIAPARTYGSVKDYGKLEAMGLAKGGRLSNVILIDDEKVINTSLRFPNEFARHKILDILGDLYLLGRPVRGEIHAKMTGHTENINLLRKIASCKRD
ncbi:MAG: UDP-3-O-acyl-N-acetylglucosamine deacetylase [Nitrospirota bacterium]